MRTRSGRTGRIKVRSSDALGNDLVTATLRASSIWLLSFMVKEYLVQQISDSESTHGAEMKPGVLTFFSKSYFIQQ